MSIDTHVGRRIGEYEIQQLIGRGSLSVAYLAEHIRLKRKVALKLFSAELAEDGKADRRLTMDWERLAHLDHPNIIPVFEAGEESGLPFIAMKHVVGRSLADTIEREGALDAEQALDILDDVAAALQFAHERGIVHREVRPHNILLASEMDPAGDRTYLSDFAIMQDTAAWRGAQTVGTRAYMAPEQLRGDPVDGRTDVYALGCVLFETLTGSAPFASEGPDGLTFAHLAKPPPSAHERDPDLPIAIDSVLQKALAKAQEDRFERPSDLLASARNSLTRRSLELPRAGGSVVVLEDLEATSPSNGALKPLRLVAAPQGVQADAASTAPGPSNPSAAVLALPKPSVADSKALDDAGPELAPSGADRAAPRRLLLVGALVAVLLLLGGAAVALLRGEDPDVRAGSPTTSGEADAGTVPTAPVETGSPGATGAVEPSLAPVAGPHNLDVAFASGEFVRLRWAVSKVGSPPARFLVFRDGRRVGSVTRPLFIDTDVGPGERHAYRVVAVGEDGSTTGSARVVANVPSLQEPAGPPPPDSVGAEAPPPPPPDTCDGIVVGDDCI
jgi:serine/threonine protein kinase